MEIKILGSGCRNCEKLEENTKKAVLELGIDAQIIKVTDFKEIAAYDVLLTPALVVDEKLVSQGKVLKPKQIIKLLN